MPGSAGAVPDEARGVYAITRHPMMWAFALWALCHIVVYPQLANIVVAVAIICLALGGAAAQDRKKGMLQPEADGGPGPAEASYWPLAAIATGRARLGGSGGRRPRRRTCGLAGRHLGAHSAQRLAGRHLALDLKRENGLPASGSPSIRPLGGLLGLGRALLRLLLRLGLFRVVAHRRLADAEGGEQLSTRSVGWAPLAIQAWAFSPFSVRRVASSLAFRGSKVPRFSMKRPSRGARASATTMR